MPSISKFMISSWHAIKSDGRLIKKSEMSVQESTDPFKHWTIPLMFLKYSLNKSN